MKEEDPSPQVDTVPGRGHRERVADQGGFQSPAYTALRSGWLCEPLVATEWGSVQPLLTR